MHMVSFHGPKKLMENNPAKKGIKNLAISKVQRISAKLYCSYKRREEAKENDYLFRCEIVAK